MKQAYQPLDRDVGSQRVVSLSTTMNFTVVQVYTQLLFLNLS
jgi:hypothetical protein